MFVSLETKAGEMAVARNPPLSTNGFDFGVSLDSNNLYLAIKIKDPLLSYQSTLGNTFDQDGLEITIDARPDPVRSMGRAYEKYFDFICIRLAPSETNGAILLSRYDNFTPPLPEGAAAAIRKTETGYSVEISIPISVLQSEFHDAPKAFHWNGNKPHDNDSGPSPWKELRLNICQYDKGKDGKIQEIWWQPPWDGPNNTPGSGTFSR